MAIWDKVPESVKVAGSKLGESTKIAASKASDAIEIAKIKARINEENKAIDGELLGIGEYFFDKLEAGEITDEHVKYRVEAILQSKERIEELQRELDAVKES